MRIQSKKKHGWPELRAGGKPQSHLFFGAALLMEYFSIQLMFFHDSMLYQTLKIAYNFNQVICFDCRGMVSLDISFYFCVGSHICHWHRLGLQACSAIRKIQNGWIPHLTFHAVCFEEFLYSSWKLYNPSEYGMVSELEYECEQDDLGYC